MRPVIFNSESNPAAETVDFEEIAFRCDFAPGERTAVVTALDTMGTWRASDDTHGVWITIVDDAKARLLAATFLTVINEWLLPTQIAEVKRRNATPEYAGTGACATHDFCDANMAMDVAFGRAMGRETFERPDGTTILDETDEHEAECAIWNAAWDIAKPDLKDSPVDASDPFNDEAWIAHIEDFHAELDAAEEADRRAAAVVEGTMTPTEASR